MAKIVTDADFQSEVLDQKGVTLVDFYADWCGPCQMLLPVIEELATEFEGKAKVVKVNVDNAGDTARKYKIMSIPTLMIIKDGKVANPQTWELFDDEPDNINDLKITWVQGKDTLKQFIENVL